VTCQSCQWGCPFEATSEGPPPYHWICSCVEGGDIVVSHIPGAENPADIFMKPLRQLKFAKFHSMLGLC